MTASYPGSIPSFTTKEDQVDINFAAHINRLQDEVKAIANELGTNPRGSFSSVRNRFNDVRDNKADTNHTHDARYWRRTLVTSKGQILVGTGVETVAAVPAGENNRALLSDSSTSTGVRWGALSHGLFGDNDGDHYEQYALADGTRGAFLPLAGGVMQGPVTFDGHRENIVPLSDNAGNVTVDAGAGTVFTFTSSGNATFTIEDSSGLDGAAAISLVITQGGGDEYSWSNVTWLGSGPPPPTAAGSQTLVSLFSVNGGYDWTGVALVEYE